MSASSFQSFLSAVHKPNKPPNTMEIMFKHNDTSGSEYGGGLVGVGGGIMGERRGSSGAKKK